MDSADGGQAAGIGALTWRAPSFEGVVGCARRDITPPLGIRARNWGAAVSDVATGVHRPLTLTALSLAGGDGVPAYLVTADLGWWRAAGDEAAVRHAVLRDLDCAPDRLLLHLVHTHAGPSLCTAEADLAGGALIAPYLQRLADAVTDACREATQRAVPAQVSWAVGRCGLAVHRDLRVDGRELVAFTPGVAADDTLVVGRAVGADGGPVATLVNYACHPTTLAWQSTVLSPDWVGAAREVVEKATGAPCLVLQGASGELSPREQYSGDPALADRHGRAVGWAALSALATLPPAGQQLRLDRVVESGAAVGVWEPEAATAPGNLTTIRVEVELVARAQVDADSADSRWSAIEQRAAQERHRRAVRRREGYVEETPDGFRARHPLWVWRLGDAAVVAHPGEAYSALQVELRRRHPDLAVMVLNLTNGPGFVYLPPAQTYGRDVYQVWQTEVAAGSLETLIDAADTLLRRTGAGGSG